MFTCKNCGSSTSMQTIQCPYCGLISENETEEIASESGTEEPTTATISEDRKNEDSTTTELKQNDSIENNSKIIIKKQKTWNFIEETFSNWNTCLKEMALVHLFALLLSTIPVIVIIVILFLSFTNLMNGDLSFLLNHDFNILTGQIAKTLLFVITILIIIITIFYFMAFASSIVTLSRKQIPQKEHTNIFITYISSIKFIPGLAIYAALSIGVIVWFATFIIALKLHELSYFLTFVIIAGFIFFILSRTLATMAILIIEKQNIFESMRSSFKLTKGKTLILTGAIFTFSVIYFAIAIGIATIGIIPILGQLTFLISQLILYPLVPSFIYSIYDLTKKIDNKTEKI